MGASVYQEQTERDPFVKYRRTQVAEMRPYVEGEVLDPRVSVSAADKDKGSPAVGDMIARNPKNHDDQWLVAAAYFAENFESVVEGKQDALREGMRALTEMLPSPAVET